MRSLSKKPRFSKGGGARSGGEILLTNQVKKSSPNCEISLKTLAKYPVSFYNKNRYYELVLKSGCSDEFFEKVNTSQELKEAAEG